MSATAPNATLDRAAAPGGQAIVAGVGTLAPAATVIVANYNGGRFVDAALRSALQQTLHPIEVVVVDDGSTDGSTAAIAALAEQDPRLILLTAQANGGPSAARNRCLDHASGRWVAVFDSDDLMHPDRLARLVAAAERDGADIAADDLLIFQDDGAAPPASALGRAAAAFWVDPAAYVRSNVLYGRGSPLGYLKPIIRADLLARTGIRYDPALRLAEDYDLILRLLLAGGRMRVYPELTYFYRKHSQSISHRLSRRALDPVLHASGQLRAAAGPAPPDLRAALDARHASIERALAFDALVQALQGRDWAGSARLAWRHPAAASLLRLPVVARLRSLVRRAPREHSPALPARQVCVISRQRVVGPTNGSSVYLLSLCRQLQLAGMDVHFVCPSPAIFGRWPGLVMLPAMAVFRSITIRGAIRIGPVFLAADPRVALRALGAIVGKALQRLGLAAGWLVQPAPYAIAAPLTREDALFLARHARARAGAIVADYAFLTDAIPYALQPGAPSAVVMHDVFSSRAAQFAKTGGADSVALLDEAAETGLLRQAGAVVAIQAAEADWVRGRLPGHTVILAPMAVTPVAAPQPGEDGRILFVGSNTAPNVLGLRWFLDAVWPILRAAAPEAALDVAGGVASAVGAAPLGVRWLGRVASLDALYRDAAVVISPLLAGSGLKIKLVEALGAGKAVVATTPTLQGVAALVGGAVTVADDPAGFAAAVAALLHDRALRMAQCERALEAACAHFSAQACSAEFVAYLAAAGAGPA